MSRDLCRIAGLIAIVCAASADARFVDLGGGRQPASLEIHVDKTRDGGGRIDLGLRLSGAEVSATEEGFTKVEVANLESWSAPGEPDVKGTGAMVAVPPGYEPELAITAIDETSFAGVLPPRQRQRRCGTPLATFAFDSALYGSSAVFPPSPVTLENVGSLQGLRLVRVALHPVRQDFARQQWKVATRLEARVSFRAVGVPARVRLPSAVYRVVKSLVVNAGSWIEPEPGAETLLVLTADAWKPLLGAFVAWKRESGMHVEVHTLTEAGGTADRVKEFLRDRYVSSTRKPSYVLFVGNHHAFPTFFIPTENGDAATDYPYALLTGKDPVPDLFYGRLVADSPQEVRTQLARWTQYEKTPPEGEWYANAMTIASSMRPIQSPSDVQYAQQVEAALRAGTYRGVDRFYQPDGTATADRIAAALAEGRSWITYIGHGSGEGWASTNTVFDDDTVHGLANSDKLPILIDVACENGAWAAPYKCFGREWVTHEWQGHAAGAVAYYGGSVNISLDPPAVMAVGIAKSHFEAKLGTLGATVLGGQLYLFGKMGVNDETRDNLTWYNLLGDPSLLVWTDTPRALRLTAKTEAHESAVKIDVRVSDATGLPVSDVKLAVGVAERESLAMATTDATGQASMVIASPLPPAIRITATGYDDRPVQTALKLW